jgi:hypothetical protein
MVINIFELGLRARSERFALRAAFRGWFALAVRARLPPHAREQMELRAAQQARLTMQRTMYFFVRRLRNFSRRVFFRIWSRGA